MYPCTLLYEFKLLPQIEKSCSYTHNIKFLYHSDIIEAFLKNILIDNDDDEDDDDDDDDDCRYVEGYL